MIVTVAEAKTHLRIQHDSEDSYLRLLIEQAQTSAEDFCRVSFEDDFDEVPKPARIAVLLMVGFYYENRDIPDMSAFKAMRMAFENLLYPYRDVSQIF